MTTNPTDGIGERLARYRRMAGYSAQRLSDITEGQISRGTIARIETGVKVEITVDELIILAMALGISPVALALPLTNPYKQIDFWGGSKVTVADLANWFKCGITELQMPIDLEGDTEDYYGTAATVVSQDTLDGVLEYNELINLPHSERNDDSRKRREQLRSRLTMLGVDLSAIEGY